MSRGVSGVTLQNFLIFEEISPRKNEMFDNEVSEMAGASADHGEIVQNIAIVVGNLLRKKRCRSLGTDSKVVIPATGSVYYPDGMIACPPNYVSRSQGLIDNPSVVFEVISKSTEDKDRGPKFRDYQTLETVREIIYLSSHEVFIELYVRGADGAFTRSDRKAGDTVELLGGELSVPVDELYEDVFETEA